MDGMDEMDEEPSPTKDAASPKPTKPGAAVPRRDKSLSALSHELIARYGKDGTVIDLDEVQVRAEKMSAPARDVPHTARVPSEKIRRPYARRNPFPTGRSDACTT